GWGRAEDRAWALEMAERALQPVRGAVRLPRGGFDLVTVDDDLGGPFPPPSRSMFARTLREAGLEVREVGPTDVAADRPVLIALYADIRGWKGRAGISARAIDAVEGVLARCAE